MDPAGRPPQGLLGRGPSLVAVSHGGDPLRWWTIDGSGEVTVPPVEPVDTLSAGDVLHGAYCHALAKGAPRVDALGFGVRAASLKVASRGPFAWRPATRHAG